MNPGGWAGTSRRAWSQGRHRPGPHGPLSRENGAIATSRPLRADDWLASHHGLQPRRVATGNDGAQASHSFPADESSAERDSHLAPLLHRSNQRQPRAARS